jgi:hypothetical protein
MRDLAYEQREINDAIRNEKMVDAAPLAVRKEAQQAFYDAIKTSPERVAERVGWLLEGQYGQGPMLQAHNFTSRMNRPAAFSQMIAVLDHNCPRRMAVEAWKKLSKPQQAKLQRLIEAEIEQYDARQREG